MHPSMEILVDMVGELMKQATALIRTATNPLHVSLAEDLVKILGELSELCGAHAHEDPSDVGTIVAMAKELRDIRVEIEHVILNEKVIH